MDTYIAHYLNDSLWCGDAIWRRRIWPELVTVMFLRSQAITWNNFDSKSVKSCGVDRRAIAL